METTTPTEFEQELLDRGYSRRQLAKVTALLGAGAVAMRTVGAAAQQAAKPPSRRWRAFRPTASSPGPARPIR